MSQPAWRFGAISGMIETAENLASDYGIDRAAADAFAARSHRRAALAMFPDKELAYDLIYRPRLQRLMRDRFRLQ